MARHTKTFQAQKLRLSDVMAIRHCVNRFHDDSSDGTSTRFRLQYDNHETEFRKFKDVEECWKANGSPDGYLRLRRHSNGREIIFDGMSSRRIFSISGYSETKDPVKAIDDLAFYLDLTPFIDSSADSISSAFIAIHFSDEGKEMARQVKELLHSIGISADTAEEFTGEQVPEKVQRMIEERDLFIAIVVPQEDKSWIKSETVFANSIRRPVAILVQEGESFEPGILGRDRETMDFPAGLVSKKFVELINWVRMKRES